MTIFTIVILGMFFFCSTPVFAEKNKDYLSKEEILWLETMAKARQYAKRTSYTSFTKEMVVQAEKALEIAEQHFAKQDFKKVLNLEVLAKLYQVTNKPQLYKPLFEQLVNINQTELSKKEQDQVDILKKLAQAYMALERYQEAESAYLDWLKIQETKLGKESPELLEIWSSLRYLYQLTGERDKYEQAQKQVRSLSDKKYPQGAPSSWASDDVLSGFGFPKEKITARIQYYEQALKNIETKSKDNDTKLIPILEMLAGLYYFQESFQEAYLAQLGPSKTEETYQRLTELKEKIKSKPMDLADSLWKLAEFYRSAHYSEAWNKAYRIYERVLTIMENSLGKDNVQIILLLQDYYKLLEVSDRDELAEEVKNRIQTISAQFADDKGKPPAMDDNDFLQESLGIDFSKFEGGAEYEYWKQNLIQVIQKYGHQSAETAMALDDICGKYLDFHDDDGKFKKQLYQKTLQIRKELFGEVSKEVALSYMMLGGSLLLSLKFKDAADYMINGVKIYQQLYNKSGDESDYRVLKDSLNNLIATLRQSKRDKEADEWQEELNRLEKQKKIKN